VLCGCALWGVMSCVLVGLTRRRGATCGVFALSKGGTGWFVVSNCERKVTGPSPCAHMCGGVILYRDVCVQSGGLLYTVCTDLILYFVGLPGQLPCASKDGWLLQP
jgi:hypothetical protein